MARRRFFVEQVRNGTAEIGGEDAKHLTRVLRVEAGQRYEISDNREVYLAEIETARKEHVIFRVIDKVAPQPLPVRLILAPALIKFDHFEWMIEKATELGVEAILPFAAVRSERGLDRAAGKRVERWRRIAMEASQQCRRDRLPEIEDPAESDAIVARAFDHRFILDELPGTPPILTALPGNLQASQTIALVLGPEGGWTGEERASFAFAGWQPVSLGPQILRAETAAIAALAILSAWGQTRINP